MKRRSQKMEMAGSSNTLAPIYPNQNSVTSDKVKYSNSSELINIIRHKYVYCYQQATCFGPKGTPTGFVKKQN
jgi:hypothetical protein